jgi:hypothetical protein
VDELNRSIPLAAVGRCAVLPTGNVNAPVFVAPPLASTIPETAVNTKLPVTSPVCTREVVVVVPALIVLIS